MKHINLRLFSSFFKIGAFTFGGGWAMISLLEEDIVNKHKWLEKEEFIDNLAIAQSLPGIMAVNVAIAVGYKLNKIWGSIFAVLGTILPSFLIILAIAMFLTPETIKNNETLTRIFKGIRPAVVALILSPVFTTAKSAKISWKNAWIPIAISLLIWSKMSAPRLKNRKGASNEHISETYLGLLQNQHLRIRWRICNAVAHTPRDCGPRMDH